MGKFNLAAAAGYGKMVSKLDTGKQDIQQIPLDKIDPNEENFFQVEDVQDLAESIEVNGVLQPLLLVQTGERYRILAGHRRYKAASGLAASGHDKFSSVPAVVLPEMSQAMEQLILIQTNTTARQLTYNEKMTAAEQLKKTLLELRKEGVKLPGKLRDIMAEQLEISKTELARMNVIKNDLSQAWKDELKEGTINPSCAYALARCSPEDQEVLLHQMEETGSMSANDVETYKTKQQCVSWIETDCPCATDGWQVSQLRKEGKPVPCYEYQKVLRHKQKGHPETCPGCCGKCDKQNTCPDACHQARNYRAREQARKEKAAADAEIQALWDASNLPIFTARFYARIQELGFDFTELTEQLHTAVKEMGMVQQLGKYSPEWMERFCTATNPSNTYSSAAAFLALCQALDCTPNWLLGYEEQTAEVWHKYPEACPDEDQLVLVRLKGPDCVDYREYVYHLGEFFLDIDAEDHDYEYPVQASRITHWIEAPSKEIS